MSNTQTSTLQAFDQISFEDRETALSCLNALFEWGGADLMDPLRDALTESPDPTRTAIGLTRYLERSVSPVAEAGLMSSSPRYLNMLASLFAQGALLTDILCRNPEYGSWLWEEAALDRGRERDEFLEEMRRSFATHGEFEDRCVWMRRRSRLEMLRIAAREVYAHAPFESVAADISLLADVMIEAAYVAARDRLRPRFGALVADEEPEREVGFVVLAMGKLGGGELNFSSDIDLLFIYSDPGHTRPDAPQQASAEEYFKKLCELIIKALSEQNAEGRVFRVDMRLRPFGKSGPLACALDGAVQYYSTCGRAWERQALIKARPCAGDAALGEVFIEQMRPFVYPRYFDDATLEDIRGIKQQTEAMTADRAQTDREVKLGRGGIRDIEFTVQILQLLHGGRWPDSRTANTLEAIRALGQRQRLSPFAAETLERNYIFLRQVEHRLQIAGGLQTHVLPESARDMDLLSRRLGYINGDAFMSVYRERARQTRAILEQFLATKGDGTLWVMELLDPEATSVASLDKLQEYGFAAPERARGELLQLANGPEDRPFTRDTAQQFALITPFLLTALSQTPDPDAALMRFGQILAQLPAPTALYSLLKYNPKLTHYLTALISNSDYFSELLVRDISMLDLIGSPRHIETASTRESLLLELEALECAANPEPALYRLRDGETLKVALRELVQGISVAAVGDELTQLAEVVIDSVLRKAQGAAAARFGPTPIPFAVLALGKFGGRELGYGSDLDLVFVYDDEQQGDDASTAPVEYFAAVASQALKTLKEPTRYGILYDVDARLRPDGSKGVLAIAGQRLFEYYTHEAQFWERFALMKVRAVAGDTPYREALEAQARDMAFSFTPTHSDLDNLESLRRKLAAAASPFDLKRREGGIAEIEFATRLMQLRHAADCPELRRGGVFGALDILADKAFISQDVYRCLYDGYLFFRQLLNRSRMMRGSSSARIPDSPEGLRRLALCLNLQDDLASQIETRAREVHDAYQHIYAETRRDS